MATPQSSHALDGRAANEPVWLDDSDLIDDDPPSPEWPFDVVPGALANPEDFYGAQHAAFSATVPPPPRHSAAVPAMAIAAAIVMTFGVGWWVGRVHPPPDQEPSMARTVRGSAHSVRAEAAPAILTTAKSRHAPAIPISRPNPAPAPFARVAPVPPVAPVASEKPTEAAARVFVPTDL
jgi:hypothetical protein